MKVCKEGIRDRNGSRKILEISVLSVRIQADDDADINRNKFVNIPNKPSEKFRTQLVNTVVDISQIILRRTSTACLPKLTDNSTLFLPIDEEPLTLYNATNLVAHAGAASWVRLLKRTPAKGRLHS